METSHKYKKISIQNIRKKYNNKFTLYKKPIKSKPCMCVSHLFNKYYYFVLSIIKIVYLYLKKKPCQNVFCSGVSSRMTKFLPCTQPGRLSTTRNTCVLPQAFDRWTLISSCLPRDTIFRASNDVGPLFVGPGSTRILEKNTR